MNQHILTGQVDVTSNLLVGSSHLFVDTTNNRVGLVTNDPHAGLHVNSNAYVDTNLRVGSQIEINETAGRIKAASFEGDGSLLVNAPVGSLAVHSTDTGLPGTDAIVTNEGTPTAAEFKFVIPRGDVGATGAAATVAVGTTTTGVPGTNASVTNTGSSSAASFDFTIPRGDTGATGPAGTVAIGTTTTGAAGSSASVTNTGTSTAATLEFTIPKGDQGIQGVQGDTGPAGTVAIGTTTTGAAGSSASVTNTGTSTAANLEFTIPRGAQGVQGPAATVAVGTTTTGAAGTNASASASTSGTTTTFSFTIPKGDKGDKGDAGDPADINGLTEITTAVGGKVRLGNDVVTNTTQGLYFHSSSDYSIARTSGSWSSPDYQQLKLKWATGIVLDPGSSYGKSYVDVVGQLKVRATSGGVYDNNYEWLECINDATWGRFAQTPRTNGIACYNGIAINTGGGLVVGSWDSPNALGAGNGKFTGTLTARTINCVQPDDSGVAQISAYGSNQGTGRLYVGQSGSYGGGIEYNGDNLPASTGAGADHTTLFRVDNGTYAWTARNYYNSNNWEFRGNVKTPLLDINGTTMSKAPRVIHIDDSRSGCPPIQAANTPIMQYDLVLSRSAYVYVSVTTILIHTARADCYIYFGGVLQQSHLTATDNTSWNPVCMTAGGTIGAGTTNIQFRCNTADVVGCGTDWGGMQILVFEQ